MKSLTCFLGMVLIGLPASVMAAPFSWGYNFDSQLGDGTSTTRLAPVAVDVSGVLASVTITAVACGYEHTLVLASDGKAYGWGENLDGQLGNGTRSSTSTAVAVDMTGALLGKTIVALACGTHHSLALTSDGLVFAWGDNTYGLLGNGTTTASPSPVAVDMTGAMLGKTIVAIAASQYHSMALSSDGKVFTWGNNAVGGLGDGTTTTRTSPVAVDTSGVLLGLNIIAIASQPAGCLALSSTGKVFGWGGNSDAQLGDGTTTHRHSPVAVDTSGALSGRFITAIAAGSSHGFALASTGVLYAWGDNSYGSLGDGTTTQRKSPVAVDASGLLSGKTVTAVSSSLHTLALTSDGTLVGWGYNYSGPVGDGTTTDRTAPVAVDVSGVLAGQAVTAIAAGSQFSVVLAAPASTTITPASRYNYAANFGWLNWRWSASASDAPVITSDILAGRVYSANVGWISLGNGTPTGSTGRYTQTSGDVGVNNDGAGNLSGYAYAANIGWIDFDQTIAAAYRPKVNIVTGAFSGYAYSANCGWIELAGIKTSFKPAPDTPLIVGGSGNGIADSWEKERAAAAGMGETLGHLANTPGADYDHDGISDADEYLADTNPFDTKDQLHVTNFSYDPTTHQAVLDWNGSTRRAFTVLYSYDLVNWTADATTAPGNGANVLITGQPSPQLFFKVQAQLPLAPTGDPGI